MGKIGGFTNLLNYDIKLTSKTLRIQYLRHPAIWQFWKSSHSPYSFGRQLYCSSVDSQLSKNHQLNLYPVTRGICRLQTLFSGN